VSTLMRKQLVNFLLFICIFQLIPHFLSNEAEEYWLLEIKNKIK
jgi:hypothetical protein